LFPEKTIVESINMKTPPKKILSEVEKKCKEIWGVLRNKKIVHFNLSIKIKQDKTSEPRTISMECERASEGGWIMSPPTYKNLGVFQSNEILKAKLQSIEENVLEYIVKNGLETEWKEQVYRINKEMDSGISADEFLYKKEISAGAYFGFGYSAHFSAPILATAYVKEGSKALAENDLELSMYCIERGLYWSDPQMFISEPKKRFSERARSGGIAKNSRHEPVKKLVVEWIANNEKDVNNVSINILAEKITDYLIWNESHTVDECHLKTENLPRVIKGWIMNDPKRFFLRSKSST
jgi:uncharacterized protein YaaR (DUF327 family)